MSRQAYTMENWPPAAERVGTVSVTEAPFCLSLPEMLMALETDVPLPALPLTTAAPAVPLGVPLPL